MIRISTIMEIPINELKKKKDSLMSSYRSYKGKVKKSAQSGAGVDDIYQPIWFAYDAMNDFLGDSLTAKKTINTIYTTPLDKMPPTQNPIRSCRSRRYCKIDALATFKSTLQKTQQPVQEDDCDLYGKLLAKKLRKLSENKKLQLMHDIDGVYLRYKFEDRTTHSPPQFHEPRPGTSSPSKSPLHYHSESKYPVKEKTNYPVHYLENQSSNTSHDYHDQTQDDTEQQE
ncbi:uncharacterized protein LOC121732732 [Aricia agestis]|uniref:uncharacterized protein LOC121732732 n=1 Tax=Aricia agestis TaxID=91739 RepID=UPI001C20C449|nr:uncharacterized protein LOC121732732 [Aricia agestis]